MIGPVHAGQRDNNKAVVGDAHGRFVDSDGRQIVIDMRLSIAHHRASRQTASMGFTSFRRSNAHAEDYACYGAL